MSPRSDLRVQTVQTGKNLSMFKIEGLEGPFSMTQEQKTNDSAFSHRPRVQYTLVEMASLSQTTPHSQSSLS